MQKIINRLRNVIQAAKSFGYAVTDAAKELGIQIDDISPNDIADVLPSDENISVSEFRLAIATAIVRYICESDDSSQAPYFRLMYDKFAQEDLLTVADMQSYHTLMFMLHPKR